MLESVASLAGSGTKNASVRDLKLLERGHVQHRRHPVIAAEIRGRRPREPGLAEIRRLAPVPARKLSLVRSRSLSREKYFTPSASSVVSEHCWLCRMLAARLLSLRSRRRRVSDAAERIARRRYRSSRPASPENWATTYHRCSQMRRRQIGTPSRCATESAFGQAGAEREIKNIGPSRVLPTERIVRDRVRCRYPRN